MTQTDDRLVSIFKTDDPAIVPLATMVLEGAGIEHSVRNSGKVDSLEWMMSQKPTNRPMVIEIFVARDVASQARDLVIDLEQPFASAPVDPTVLAIDAADSPSIRLEDASTGMAIGTITEAQLQELTSHLEEEAPRQYFVGAATIEMLKDAHADPALIDVLRRAAGAGDGVTIRWTV